jgi:hypothetical protein
MSDASAVLYTLLTRYPQFRGKTTQERLDEWAKTYLDDVGALPADLLEAAIGRVLDTPWEWPYPPPAALVRAAALKMIQSMRLEARRLCREGERELIFDHDRGQRMLGHSLQIFDTLARMPGGLRGCEARDCSEMRATLALPPPEMVPLRLPIMDERSGQGALRDVLKEIAR